AVDALDLAVEGERDELDLVGVAGDLEDEVAVERPGEDRALAADLDERAGERRDEQPGALADGVGAGAHTGLHRRHGPPARRPPSGAGRGRSAPAPAPPRRDRARRRAACGAAPPARARRRGLRPPRAPRPAHPSGKATTPAAGARSPSARPP